MCGFRKGFALKYFMADFNMRNIWKTVPDSWTISIKPNVQDMPWKISTRSNSKWSCKWFFKDSTKTRNGRQRSTPNFWAPNLRGAKTLKISQKLLSSHFPWYGNVQLIFSRLKFKIAAPNQFFFRGGGGGGGKKLVRSYSNFRITFPTIHGDVQVISFKVLLKFKMAAKDHLHKLWVQKLLFIQSHSHNLEMCRLKILLKFKMAAMDDELQKLEVLKIFQLH